MQLFALPDHQLGDAWYFAATDLVHAYFLTRPLDTEAGWDIGHAISSNLIDWEYVGLALRRGPDGAWDSKSLATGGVIWRDGLYWMAYTGHKKDEALFVQRVGMAFSRDLQHWEKLPENPTSVAAARYYEIVSSDQRTLTHWRDPFLLDTGAEVIQYVCARRTEGDESKRGSVGLARSTDMRNWEVLAPPEHDRMSEEMEVPQVYEIAGRWYLVFCTHAHWLDPTFVGRFPGHPFRSTDYSMVGDSPLGPFRLHGTGEIMPQAPPCHFYASQLVCLGEKWFLLGTVRDDEGTRISDPLPIEADETGLHLG